MTTTTNFPLSFSTPEHGIRVNSPPEAAIERGLVSSSGKLQYPISHLETQGVEEPRYLATHDRANALESNIRTFHNAAHLNHDQPPRGNPILSSYEELRSQQPLMAHPVFKEGVEVEERTPEWWNDASPACQWSWEWHAAKLVKHYRCARPCATPSAVYAMLYLASFSHGSVPVTFCNPGLSLARSAGSSSLRAVGRARNRSVPPVTLKR